MEFENSFKKGLKDGIPIGLGYLSVSFTFGMMAVSQGLPVWVAVFISMTNLTSAGQFAGLSLILTGGGYIEMAMTQLIINLRYALMSLSLSQKLHKTVKIRDRLLMSFANTDEIFAVASSQPGEIGKRYFYGLMTVPYVGWALGTLLGALASTLLPEIVTTSMSVAIYGMFLAIIVPPAKHNRSVLMVITASVILSCCFTYIPVINQLSSGFVIIICAVVASTLGALLFPIKEAGDE